MVVEALVKTLRFCVSSNIIGIFAIVVQGKKLFFLFVVIVVCVLLTLLIIASGNVNGTTSEDIVKISLRIQLGIDRSSSEN